MSNTILGPHQAIVTTTVTERFLCELFDRLWDVYRQRVGFVRDYEQVVGAARASFVNDHIAFRTFATQDPHAGIASLSRVFDALGYRAAGCYNFPGKHLSAIHFQHPNGQLPKLFISELKTWELSPETQALIGSVTGPDASPRPPLDARVLSQLLHVDSLADVERTRLLDEVVQFIHQLPWRVPQRDEVVQLNEASQYAAWVAVHGYNVNHFTSLINSHAAATLDTIDKTIAALSAAGVPMKAEVEGAPGSKLRQSATQAAVIDVAVRDGDQETTMPWTYAYFELAERGNIIDPDSGQPIRFEGFLGPQATQLFDMTRVD